MQSIYKDIVLILGGIVGWCVAVFQPAVPLMSVMVCFCVVDAYSAYLLSKRVASAHPDQAKYKQPKFSSFLFGKVVSHTIPVRICCILLSHLADQYVALHVELNLAYIVTGAICFEQAWSILENMSSCEPNHRLWVLLRKILVDKTERHLGIDLDGDGEIGDNKAEKDETEEHTKTE